MAEEDQAAPQHRGHGGESPPAAEPGTPPDADFGRPPDPDFARRLEQVLRALDQQGTIRALSVLTSAAMTLLTNTAATADLAWAAIDGWGAFLQTREQEVRLAHALAQAARRAEARGPRQ
jgi:hypothetical protein